MINNKTQYNFFVVPFSIERDSQSIVIDLVFRSSDFYLQRFTYNTNYYHFSDSTITTISDQTSRNLHFDSNYNTLIGQSDPSISWVGINQAFNDLINYGENPDSSSTIATIRGALARVILATAESMRFRQVRTNISNSNNQTFSWRSDFYDTITNWGCITNNAIDYLISHGNLNNFVSRNVILIFTSSMFKYLHKCSNSTIRKQRDLNNNQYCYSLEKNFFYDNYNHKDLIVTSYSGNDLTTNLKIYNINLGDINPLNFNKISILYDHNSDIYTKISFGNDSNFGTKITDFFENHYIKDIIMNKKFNYSDYKNGDLLNDGDLLTKLIDWNPNDLVANQRLGLSFYWENKNYYLQLIVYQTAKNITWLFAHGGEMWIGIGKGIRLSF